MTSFMTPSYIRSLNGDAKGTCNGRPGNPAKALSSRAPRLGSLLQLCKMATARSVQLHKPREQGQTEQKRGRGSVGSTGLVELVFIGDRRFLQFVSVVSLS